MNEPWLQRRPRWAFPFTILSQPDTVRLAAGEDYRYTLTEPCLDAWLPPVLTKFTGQFTLGEILDAITPPQRAALQAIVERLYGERVLVDGPADAAHDGRPHLVQVDGHGELRDWLGADYPADGRRPGRPLLVYCQDRLDYAEAQQVDRRCRREGVAWLWCSTGAVQRGYVGPLFLPDAGPCFTCLLRRFQSLSPAPELYDAIAEHGRQGKSFAPASFPRWGMTMLRGLVQAKLAQAAGEQAAPALYRLHVLELETMEVTAHRVFADPECPACREDRP